MTEGKSSMTETAGITTELCSLFQQQSCSGTLHLKQCNLQKNVLFYKVVLHAILYIPHPCMSTVLPQRGLEKRRILLDCWSPGPLHQPGHWRKCYRTHLARMENTTQWIYTANNESKQVFILQHHCITAEWPKGPAWCNGPTVPLEWEKWPED